MRGTESPRPVFIHDPLERPDSRLKVGEVVGTAVVWALCGVVSAGIAIHQKLRPSDPYVELSEVHDD